MNDDWDFLIYFENIYTFRTFSGFTKTRRVLHGDCNLLTVFQTPVRGAYLLVIPEIHIDTAWAYAEVKKMVRIPKTAAYNLWVRYESAYGFGSLFEIKIEQAGQEIANEQFGGISDRKYFPFSKGYTVQGPWYWHGADFACFRFDAVDCPSSTWKFVLGFPWASSRGVESSRFHRICASFPRSCA